MRARDSVIVMSGERMRFTPPASAVRQPSVRSARQARCTATSEDEHAVSTERLGPCRPST